MMTIFEADEMETNRNYIAFDLEIYKIVPGDFNYWRSHRPLGISCAATCTWIRVRRIMPMISGCSM